MSINRPTGLLANGANQHTAASRPVSRRHGASPPHRTRAATAARVGLGLVVASTLLGASAPARAQSAPTATLGGFTGSAQAAGMHVQYNPEGLLPTGAPVDFNTPDALATIASGPSTFARAGVADPGDLLANPDALLSAASSDYPQGSIPAWPLRITAGSGVGAPTAESNPAPGFRARVTAEGSTSTAEAHAPGLAAPAVVTIGSLSSYADTSTDGTTVRVHARVEMSGVSILGVIQIESIVTDLTATSTGTGTTTEGGTVVTGASIAGTPVEIDDEGVRSLGIDLGDVLGPLGINVTLPGPVELQGGTTGQRASTGLRVEIIGNLGNQPVIGDILDGLPPIDPIIPGAPSPEDLIAAAQANNVVVVEIGRGVVSLTARTPAPRVTPSAPSSPSAPSAPSSDSAPVARPVLPSTSPAAPIVPAATPAAAAPVVAPAVPASSVGVGVGALAALLLVLQPLIGDRLARVAVAQLATDQEGCSWERR